MRNCLGCSIVALAGVLMFFLFYTLRLLSDRAWQDP